MIDTPRRSTPRHSGSHLSSDSESQPVAVARLSCSDFGSASSSESASKSSSKSSSKSASKSVRFAPDAERPPVYQRYDHLPPPPLRTRRHFFAMVGRYAALAVASYLLLVAAVLALTPITVLFCLERVVAGVIATAVFAALLIAGAALRVVADYGQRRYKRWFAATPPPRYVYINRRFVGRSHIARKTRVELKPRNPAGGWTSDRRVFAPRDAWLDTPCRVGDAVSWSREKDMPSVEEALGYARV